MIEALIVYYILGLIYLYRSYDNDTKRYGILPVVIVGIAIVNIWPYAIWYDYRKGLLK